MYKLICFRLVAMLPLMMTCQSYAGPDYLLEIFESKNDGPEYQYQILVTAGSSFTDYTYDPRQKPGKRLRTYFEYESEEPYNCIEQLLNCNANNSDNLKTLEKYFEQEFWCKSVTDSILGNDRLEIDTNTTATYLFEKTFNNFELEEVSELGPLLVYATIDKKKPAVLAYTMHLQHVYTPNPIVRITAMSIETECERTPDGRTYAKNKNIYINGEIAGKEFEMINNFEIFNLKAAKPAP